MGAMREQLSSYGIDLVDHKYASILVSSLPPNYDSTLASILAAAKLTNATLKPDTMVSLITDKYNQRQLKRKGKKDSDAAYYAGGGFTSKKDIEVPQLQSEGALQGRLLGKGWRKGRPRAEEWTKGRIGPQSVSERCQNKRGGE